MYNFDDIANRRNTYSYKWDVKENELPMWVADMDFKCLPEISLAIKKRLEIGAFGYSYTPDEYYEAFISFWKRRHNVLYKREDMVFSTGVVPSLSSSVRALSKEDDGVIIFTPVYNIFFNSIRNNKRRIIECPLIYKNDYYEIDFDLFSQLAKDKKNTLLIFCNPGNPVGRIWTKEELERVAKIAYDNGIIIVSDEIHADIARSDMSYIPFYSLSDIAKNNSISLISATKCFNMAGIQASAAISHNKEILKKFDRDLNTSECAEGNFFSFEATIAALNNGDIWLNELNQYIDNNFLYLEEYINKNLPKLKLTKREATYLEWINIKAYSNDSVKFRDFIRKRTGLYLSDGREYGEAGEGFLRINLATSKKNLIDGLDRLNKAIKIWENENN